MKKITLSMTEEMYDDLEKERKKRRLSSVAERSEGCDRGFPV